MKKDIWNTIVIVCGIVSVIMILLGIGVIIPLISSDGWEKLDGIAIAEDKPYILSDGPGVDRFSTNPAGFFFKTRVVGVKYTPIGNCTSQNDIRAYTITTKTIGLFGITTREQVHQPALRSAGCWAKYVLEM